MISNLEKGRRIDSDIRLRKEKDSSVPLALSPGHMVSFVYRKRRIFGGGLPCCICGMDFDIGPDEIYWDDENLRPQPGLYTKHQLQQMPFVERLDWHCVYRVISGVTANMAAVDGQVLEAVPWDEMLGAIGYPEEDRDRLVQAIGLDQFNDTGTHGLVGYHLHDSCWELLTHHTIGEAARQSLVLVVRNLKELPADPWEYIDGMCPVEGKYSLCCRVNRQHNRLCYLPVEILCRVMDYLSPDDVEVVQVAMKYYLGDAYWRTRVTISRFPEVKSIWHETLDWQFLCLELEWLWETDDLAFDDMFSTG
ncbi:unnamed protein product [Aspergillus oryzae var. brunneus]|uniref:Unnamed protein product n=1 Tax=Aspergillus oryzae var. brunneus TaxID=332754 RepID=A0ABQ6KQ02_ASPOZ|nr:unnamed protein product [Aspergillus oryzae var. brunneus]